LLGKEEKGAPFPPVNHGP